MVMYSNDYLKRVYGVYLGRELQFTFKATPYSQLFNLFPWSEMASEGITVMMLRQSWTS